MKTIQLNKVKYQCPTSWDDILLRQQIAVSSIADKEDSVKVLALLSGYCDIPIDVLKRTPTRQVLKVFKNLGFLKNVKIPTEPLVEFKYKGESYSITDSIINNEFQDWVSIDAVLTNHKDNIWEATPYLIAILAKKEGENLDDFNLEERAKHFEDLPVSIANRVSVFFSLNVKIYQVTSLLYLNKEKIIQEKQKEVENLLNKQVGGGLLTRLLRGTLRKYLKFLNSSWTKYYNTSQLKS